MIRLGLVGCGVWGRNYARAAELAGNCIVTHVAGSAALPPGSSSVRRVASREWRRLLTAPIDAFVVATPPEAREEACLEILARDRPLMVEKPMALSSRVARVIWAAAEEAGAPLLVAHQHLFAPAYEGILDRARGAASYRVYARNGALGPFRSYPAIWDYGPHDAAMFLGIAGTGGLLADCWGTANGDLRLEAEAGVGTLRAVIWNHREPKARDVTVVADRGGSLEVFLYDDLAPGGRKLRRGIAASGSPAVEGKRVLADLRPIAVSGELPLTRAVRAFARAAQTGSTDWRFGAFGPAVVELVERAAAKLAGRRAMAS